MELPSAYYGQINQVWQPPTFATLGSSSKGSANLLRHKHFAAKFITIEPSQKLSSLLVLASPGISIILSLTCSIGSFDHDWPGQDKAGRFSPSNR